MQIEYVKEELQRATRRSIDFVSSDKSRRGDTGKYELTLRNSKGEVKVPIDVTVLGTIGRLRRIAEVRRSS